MTAITATLHFEQRSSPIEEGWRGCKGLYHRHSDLITSLSNLALNTAILVAKIFRQIPQILARSSYALLNFTGVCSLNIQFRDLVKSGKDLLGAVQSKDFEGMLVTATKVMVKGINILCTCSLFAAAIASLVGHPEIALVMYAVMRPFALISLVCGIGTEIYDYRKNRQLIQKLTEIENDTEKERRIETIMGHFLGKSKGKEENSDRKLGRELYRQLDHFTLETLMEKEAQLFPAITQAMKDKQTYTSSNLGLIALGYVAMGVCRLWPDTLAQSGATLGISLLYTAKLVHQKVKTEKLRDGSQPTKS